MTLKNDFDWNRARKILQQEQNGMEKRVIKVLLIEDDEDDYILTQALLNEIGLNEYHLDWESSYEKGLEAVLKCTHDVCLLDYRLGKKDGLQLLVEAEERGAHPPIILLTGQGRYELDVKAMNSGAADYLVKNELQPAMLERSIRYTIDRRQSEERILQEIARADSLVRISARLSSSLNLDEVMEAICEESAKALHTPAASLNLYNSRSFKFYHAAGWGLPASFKNRCRPISRSLYREYNSPQGQVKVIPDVRSTTGLVNASLYTDLDIRSIASVAILRNGKPLGLLNVYGIGEERHFSDEDLTLIKCLADQAALALSNARLYELERARSSELAAISYISTLLREAPSTKEVLPAVLREVHKLLKTDAGAVLLLKHNPDTFYFATADGFLSANVGSEFPASQGVSKIVMETGRPYVTSDYLKDPHHLSSTIGLDKCGSALYVPLQSEVETIGTLVLTRQRSAENQTFSPSEVRLLEVIGEIVGNALRRARLFDDAQRRLQYTQALNDIDKAIASTLDLHRTLSVALARGTALLGVDAASVLLLNHDTLTLRYVAGYGFRTRAIEKSHLHLGKGNARAAAL